jgi:pimeloyl-ACP methyl ester carboxylesterase
VPITDRERSEVEAANSSGQQPVMFVHGLWFLAASWDPWRSLFADRGYATLAPGWPDDPETAEEARAQPDVLAGKSLGQITDHYVEVINGLTRRPAIVGHSFGGLLAQKLAGMGLSAGTVAIDPAPFRGVLPLPVSALRSSFPVLKSPGNRKRAVMLSYDEFRYAFANQVSEDEAHELYDKYAVPGPGYLLFQAAFANINPKTEASVDTDNPARGPLLVISGEKDHTVPHSISHASFRRYKKSDAITEFTDIAGRGHSLVVDAGWREVAETALTFLGRYGAGPT